MLNRALALFMALVLTIMLFTAGIIAGINMQADYENKAYTASMAQSLKIAVVNQDMGVDYNGRGVNFASEIIDTFGDEFILAPKAAAESGVKNGRYAAVVSFPGNFSNQVVQINMIKPETATFKYQLSSNLSQKDCIETLLKIMLLEKHVNETLTFMYTTSVFGELHDAQSTVKEIINNEDTGIESVYKFVSAEMITELEISNMDVNVPEVDYPDFLNFISENDLVLNNLLDKYAGYMSLAADDYGKIISDAESVISDTQSVSSAIDNIDILPPDKFEQGDYFDHVLSEKKADNNERFSQLKDRLTRVNDDIALFHENIATPGSIGMPQLSETDYSDLCGTQIYDILLSMIDSYECATSGTTEPPATSGNTADTEQYIDIAIEELLEIFEILVQYQRDIDTAYVASFVSDLLILSTDNIDAEFANLLTEFDSVAGEEDAALDVTIADMRDYIKAEQESAKSTLTSAYDARNQKLSELGAQMALYDPAKYISENRSELDGFNTRFRDNNQVWNESIGEALDTRSELVFDTYTNYGEYVGKLKEDMQSVTTQSKELLDTELEKLLSFQLDKKEHNLELIGDFSEKLPNTQIGSQGNNDFYSFFVTPVKISEIGYGTQSAFSPPVQKGITGTIDWLQIIIRLLALVFVVAAGGYFLIKGVIRKRRNNPEDTD